MKKIFKIARLLFTAFFAVAAIMLFINALSIYQAAALVENVIGENVKYFSDKLILTDDYHRFKDESSNEYWVNKYNHQISFIKNSIDENEETVIPKSEAVELAYREAEKWNKEFFYSNTSWELIKDSQYEFYIFEIDDKGMKTGKFIIAKVTGDLIDSLSMHTYKDDINPASGSCMSENAAIISAYEQTTLTETALNIEDDYLLRTYLYKEDTQLIWKVIIWDITAQEISDIKKAVDTETYYTCIIDANTNEVLSYGWDITSSDYCPLTGEILIN